MDKSIDKDELEPTTLLGGQVKLHQPEFGFRAAIDTVLLASSVIGKSGEKLLDLGCGTGGAGLSAAGFNPGLQVYGLDIQSDLIAIAKFNASENAQDADNFQTGSVTDKPQQYEYFDHVIANPPYQQSSERLVSPDQVREQAFAHSESSSLADWISYAHKVLKQKGRLSIIHRADMLQQILYLCGTKFGAYEIWQLQPREEQDAKRVIVQMVKGRQPLTQLHRPIILHKEDGRYTERTDQLLKGQRRLINYYD